MPNPAVSDIITRIQNIIREETGSDLPVMSDDFLLDLIADIDREVARAYRKSNGNRPVDFVLEYGTTLAPDTAVNDAGGIGASNTSITVDATDSFETSGAAAVWTKDMPDVFYYTSDTSTTLDGVTGLGANHYDNDTVQALYALPTNFGKLRRDEKYRGGVQLNGDPLVYTSGAPDAGEFTIRDNGTAKFLWIYRGATGDVTVLFDKDSNTIDSTDDLVSFSDDWFFFYIWRGVETALFGRGDYPIIPLAKDRADTLKLDLLKDRNVGRMVRVRQYTDRGDDSYLLAQRENAL